MNSNNLHHKSSTTNNNSSLKNTSKMHKLTRQSTKVTTGVPLHARSPPRSLSARRRRRGPSPREVAASRWVPIHAEVSAPIHPSPR
uniref:Uncharacterized protein n=1 Tax=Oryza meridionalis TaxID=40149 RepID=A0A0E0EYG9_9ORYZ